MNNTPFLPAIDDDVRHVIGVFQDEIADAHFHIGQRFLRAFSEYQKQGRTELARQEIILELRSIPYTLWGLMSAATRRAKREVVFQALLKEKAQGVDIPPSVVHHVARAVLGHGFDEKAVMHRFAEKDRTAADKTATTLDDLTETIDRLNQIIHTVDAHIQAVRVEENTRWENSTEYRLIAEEIRVSFPEPIKGVPVVKAGS